MSDSVRLCYRGHQIPLRRSPVVRFRNSASDTQHRREYSMYLCFGRMEFSFDVHLNGNILPTPGYMTQINASLTYHM